MADKELNSVKHPNAIVAPRAPIEGDRRYKVGSAWIDKVEDKVYFLTSVRAGVATWVMVGEVKAEKAVENKKPKKVEAEQVEKEEPQA